MDLAGLFKAGKRPADGDRDDQGPSLVPLLAAYVGLACVVLITVGWLTLYGTAMVEDRRRAIDDAGLTIALSLPTVAWPEETAAPDRAQGPARDDGAEAQTQAPADRPSDTVPDATAMPSPQTTVPVPEPDPELLEETPYGSLPRIAADGRAPWHAYAAPFDADDPRPRIVMVIHGLGLAADATGAVIDELPASVTLAFSPFTRDLDGWLTQARGAGHEVVLMVPMEPEAFPQNDPGPQALLVSLDAEQNRRRLEWLLARAAGYVGVMNGMGSRFTAASEAMGPVLRHIHERGLLFVDAATTPRSVAPRLAPEIGLPFVAGDRVIDDIATRDAIDLRLRELEEIARERGVAVGLGSPYPVTRERLLEWAAGLERKGLVLAPVTAVVAAPGGPERRDG